MASKYNDSTAIIQVIGCVYNNISLLDNDDTYYITDEDFCENFHKIVFGAMYNLYQSGASAINIKNIVDFLQVRPKQYAVFESNKGVEYLNKASSVANQMTFKYYYERMKKMTLLRAYDNIGLDVSFLYDPDNIMDLKKKEIQEQWLDNSSLQSIADTIDSKITLIYSKQYIFND